MAKLVAAMRLPEASLWPLLGYEPSVLKARSPAVKVNFSAEAVLPPPARPPMVNSMIDV